ncbi:hypothetical protein S83_067922, partial [Arachis hypogaea]
MSRTSSVPPAFQSIKSLPPDFKVANNLNGGLSSKNGDVRLRSGDPVRSSSPANGALVVEVSKEVHNCASNMDVFDEDSPYSGQVRLLEEDRPSNGDEDSESVPLPLSSNSTSTRESRWCDTTPYASKK